MINYCLKFADENEAASLLPEYRHAGAWIVASHTHAICVVGEIPGQAGYHLNLVCDALPESLSPFQVFPATPSVVWA